MRALRALVGAVHRALVPPTVDREERAHVANNLRVLLRAVIVGSALAALMNLAVGLRFEAVLLGGLCALLIGALWLLEHGTVQIATVLALGSMIGGVHFALLTEGFGIHHRALIFYPVIILIAAMLLDLRVLVATTTLCTLSVVLVVWLEHTGLLRTPFSGRFTWAPMIDIPIAFVVTAVAVYLLVTGVVRGMLAARAKGRSLSDANRELEARSAELEQFTYVVSHDLKSPLVTIRGFLGYLERDARDGEMAKLEADVARIRSATDRMNRLLDDLQELSRTGRIARERADVPFLEVVREARALVEGQLAGRGVKVEVEGPLPVVHGDPHRLVALMQNLLDNAAKFMGDQIDPQVRIGCRADTLGDPVFYVRDNGIGIAPSHQRRVFELFQRLDPRQEGTGVGLAVASRIVEMHGGRIWVESEGVGLGSTFCFTLPRITGSSATAAAPSDLPA